MYTKSIIDHPLDRVQSANGCVTSHTGQAELVCGFDKLLVEQLTRVFKSRLLHPAFLNRGNLLPSEVHSRGLIN